MVSVAGFEVRWRKTPDEARVAETEQLPAATGVITPEALIEHLAGVVVAKENAPSPEPPAAVALALWLTLMEVAESVMVTASLCGARTPKKLAAFATGATKTEKARANAADKHLPFITHQSFW